MADKVFVDFDKTLTTGEGPPYWEDDSYEAPDEDVVEWVNDQYKSGASVVVWTARPWSQAAEVVGYLVQWGVMWHGIRCGKGGADVYLDDKSVHPDEVRE